MFWYALLCVHSDFAIILMRKRELVASLLLPFSCLVVVFVLWLYLTVPWDVLQSVIVVFPDHTHLLLEANVHEEKHNANYYLRIIRGLQEPVTQCLFVLILYIPVNNFSAMSGWVFLGRTNTKQRIKCLTQGHNTVTSRELRLKLVTLQSQTLPIETLPSALTQ